jgi:TrmH family RNA methyltransferase
MNIESVNNPRVVEWNHLKQKKGREQQGLYLLEGSKLIAEALQAKQQIVTLIIGENYEPTEELAKILVNSDLVAETIYVSEAIIAKLSDTITPQGIIAVIRKHNTTFAELIAIEKPIFLIIDELQDPGNLGAMVRSADAAGIAGIIIGQESVELYNPKVIRSAMGSIFHLPIVVDADLAHVLPLLRSKGIRIYGTSPHADNDYYDIDLKENIAIIIGNEAKGLSSSRIAMVDEMIRIPIVGQAESLNAAIATAIILYEHVRQQQL